MDYKNSATQQYSNAANEASNKAGYFNSSNGNNGPSNNIRSGISSPDNFDYTRGNSGKVSKLAALNQDSYVNFSLSDFPALAQDDDVSASPQALNGLNYSSTNQMNLNPTSNSAMNTAFGNNSLFNLPGLNNPYSYHARQTKPTSSFVIQSEDFPALPHVSESPNDIKASGAPGDLDQAQERRRSFSQAVEDPHINGLLESEFGVYSLLKSLRSSKTQSKANRSTKTKIRANLFDFGIKLPELDMKKDSLLSCLNSPFTSIVEKPILNEKFKSPVELPRRYVQSAKEIVEVLNNEAHNEFKMKREHFTKMKLGTLFMVFYYFPKTWSQLLSAQELYLRGWKFHKELKLWLHPTSNQSSLSDLLGSEKKSFVYFDWRSWTNAHYTKPLKGNEDEIFYSSQHIAQLFNPS